jgi:hypothetical protein
VDMPFASIGDAACWGTGVAAAVFVGIGLFFAFKAVLANAARWLTRRGKEGLGMYED